MLLLISEKLQKMLAATSKVFVALIDFSLNFANPSDTSGYIPIHLNLVSGSARRW